MAEMPDNIVPITRQARSAAREFGAAHDRELLTILFTDLVDSTKQQSELGNVEAARLTELHRKIVREELAKYDAREIDWAGDSCLAVFTRPSDAIVFALRVQATHRRERTKERKLPFVRVGLHLGEVVVKKRYDRGETTEDLFGLQVSEAARVMSVARGGQIFCTRAVFDNARGALKGSHVEGLADIVWRVHGLYALKGSEEPVEICEVGEDELTRFAPPQRNDKCRKVHARQSRLRNAFLGIAIGGVSVALVLATQNFRNVNAPESPRAAHTTHEEQTVAPDPRPVKRYSMSLPFDQAVATPGITSYSLAFSPDGRRLVYVATRDTTKMLALRQVDRLGAEVLAGTEGARNPFFSPDGQWIGFFTQPGGQLKKVSVHGGATETLCPAPLPLGAYWGEDGIITFAARVGAGLMRVPDAGGEALPLTSLDDETGEIVHMFPAPLPEENAIIVTTGTAPDINRAQVEVLNLENGKRTIIATKAVRGQYVPTGHIVYVQQGSFMAVPFSVDTMEVTGPPFDITEERMTTSDWAPREYAFSAEGSLAFVPQEAISTLAHTILWVDRNRSEEIVTVPQRPYYQARLSPDDRQIALTFSGSHDIWIFDLERGTNRRLTFDPANDNEPVWSPDGRALAFSSGRDIQYNIFVKSVDGTDPPEKLFSSSQIHHPRSWIANGQIIVYQVQHPDTGQDIGMVSVDDVRTPRSLVATPSSELAPAPSHDGMWLSYSSDESGQFEVFVQPLLDPGERVQVSSAGGKQPQWNPTKHELFYRDGKNFVAVDIELDDGWTVSPPRVLFEDTFYGISHDRPTYDVSRDGERFLFIREPEEADSRAHAEGTELVVVENWFEELKRLAPVPEGN